MQHKVEELFTIWNGTERTTMATITYVKANKIPVLTNKRDELAYDKENLIYATHKISGIVHNKQPIRVLDKNGIKLIYLFGEKIWFNSQEERDEFSQNYWAEENKKRARNKMIKAITEKLANLSDDELQKIFEKI